MQSATHAFGTMTSLLSRRKQKDFIWVVLVKGWNWTSLALVFWMVLNISAMMSSLSSFRASEWQLSELLPCSESYTPEEFMTGHFEKYVNLPLLAPGVTPSDVQARVEKALSRPVDKPFGLLHEANPPGHDVVMGLAAYPSAMRVFRTVVGSLRHTGYDGHIILGVHSEIPTDEQEYLKKMDVTFYAVEFVSCDESISVEGNNEGNVVRGLCAKGLEKLKLEWGRFEMARQWLHACEACSGWALVMDTRDIFFQAHPFDSLPAPESSDYDLLFVEEISKHTCPVPNKCEPHRYYVLDNSFYKGNDKHCYGKYHEHFKDRPVLNSGTIIGNRKGMHRFLSVYVDQFYENNASENLRCRSPHTTDQFTLQYMYYNGMFGEPERTRTSPYGSGPVLTVGHACVNSRMEDPKERHSQKDMMQFDTENTGLIVNPFVDSNSKARIAPVIHQFDRCHRWIQQMFREKDEAIFGGRGTPLDEIPPLPWQT